MRRAPGLRAYREFADPCLSNVKGTPRNRKGFRQPCVAYNATFVGGGHHFFIMTCRLAVFCAIQYLRHPSDFFGVTYSAVAHFLACTGRYFAVFLLSVPSFSVSGQTTRSPSTASSIPYFLSTNWSNSSGVFAAGGTSAEVSGNTAFFSSILLTGGFGFTIPATDVLEGIEVTVRRRRSNGNNVREESVELTKDGGASYTDTDYEDPDNWSTSFTPVTYGGPDDLWGTNWTPDEINSPNFGVGILIGGLTTLFQSVGGSIDHIQITFYHSSLVPITLTRFDGKLMPAGTVQLTWSTASELNNDHFTIERSADGEQYEALAEVAGSGTTNTVKHYSYEDRMPLS